MFVCTEVSDTESRLSADLEVDCNGEDLADMRVTIAIPMVLVYLLPIPILAFFSLRKYSGPGSHFYFLSSGFVKSKYFWFLMVMLRQTSILAGTSCVLRIFLIRRQVLVVYFFPHSLIFGL